MTKKNIYPLIEICQYCLYIIKKIKTDKNQLIYLIRVELLEDISIEIDRLPARYSGKYPYHSLDGN